VVAGEPKKNLAIRRSCTVVSWFCLPGLADNLRMMGFSCRSLSLIRSAILCLYVLAEIRG